MVLAKPRSKLRLIALGLAAMHLLPATHHIGDFVRSPSTSDAWKGFGAVFAVIALALPVRFQARIAKTLWTHRAWGMAISLLLVVAHLVPAADHVPKLVTSLAWSDAWRGIGASIAIAWFIAPRAWQVAGIRWGVREVETKKLGVAFVVGAIIWVVLAVSSTGFAA